MGTQKIVAACLHWRRNYNSTKMLKAQIILQRASLQAVKSQNPLSLPLCQKCCIIHRFTSSDSKIRNDIADSSSVVDGLNASSNWRKGQLSKISDKFKTQEEIEGDNDDDDDSASQQQRTNLEGDVMGTKIAKGTFAVDETRQPLEINNDEDVQQMWKDMESRVTRRKSMTLAEAKFNGKSVGRKNLRKTDEEAWLEAGLYQDDK